MGADKLVYYADQSDLTQKAVLGLSIQAARIGEMIIIKTSGQLIEPSWHWELNKFIYLAENGLLTQDIPTQGRIIEIGIPLTESSLLIRIRRPIKLS
jgi:hypothetical protein